jgi:plasmid maintenance system antidote protein VapI
MRTTEAASPEYRVDLLREDMAGRGWLQTDLARAAGVADMTVTRFLRGDFQTARTAAKLAKALGYSPKRYLVRQASAAA